MSSVAALGAPRMMRAVTAPLAPLPAPAVELERVALGLRGARARTGLGEADVVALLERQGIALSVPSLRRSESSGVIALSLAACLADIYGTTTDILAGRRLLRKQPSLDAFPAER